MDSVYTSTHVDATEHPSGSSGDSDVQNILQGVLRVSREWIERLPMQSAEHKTAIHLAALTESLSGRAVPHLAMTRINALLCENCRRLNASGINCVGRSLESCPVLNSLGVAHIG
jgi:hypothetical protein